MNNKLLSGFLNVIEEVKQGILRGPVGVINHVGDRRQGGEIEAVRLFCGEETAVRLGGEDMAEMRFAAARWTEQDQVRTQPLIWMQQHTDYRRQFRGGDEAVAAVAIAGFQVEGQLQ